MPVPLKVLKKQLKDFGRDLAKYPIMKVDKASHQVRAAVGVKTLTHKMTTLGSKGDRYDNVIRLHDVQFHDKPRKGRQEVMVGNKKWYYTVPDANKTKISLKGSDPDFRFRFEYPLFKKKSLIGNWRRYKRKTPPLKYPANPKNPNPIGYDFANPDDLLGMGKHQWSSLVWLKIQGLIK